MAKIKKIVMPRGLRKEITDVLGYSGPAVDRAVNGLCDTEISRAIRAYALEHGGVEQKRRAK
jgi:hypothetical protein